jgi:hypothetical protein
MARDHRRLRREKFRNLRGLRLAGGRQARNFSRDVFELKTVISIAIYECHAVSHL